MSAENVTRLKAIAVAGLAPRRAARSHHSRNPTRWARLGAKTAMSCGTSPSTSGTSMLAASATSSSDTPKP